MTWLADLYVAHPFWIWAAIAALILAAEVPTGTGWLLWPAACAAVVAALTVLLKGDFTVELAVFAVLTIASTLLARRYLPRNASGEGPDINDNVGRLVGHVGGWSGMSARRSGPSSTAAAGCSSTARNGPR